MDKPQDDSPQVRGPPEVDEQLLLERARGGDLQAFEGLYRRYVGQIYALCLRMTGEPARAEDCTQEAFIRGWQKLAGFRGESAFGTWLHRIAVNEVLGRQRRDKRRGRHLALVDEDRDETRSVRPQTDKAMDLDRAIQSLPPGARQVFVLASVYGYSHEEIGKAMSIAVGSSKAQLHRARKLLAERLEL